MKEKLMGGEKFNREEVINELRRKVAEIDYRARKGESFPGSEAVTALVNAATKLGAHEAVLEGYIMNYRELKEKFEECTIDEEKMKFVDNLKKDINGLILKIGKSAAKERGR